MVTSSWPLARYAIRLNLKQFLPRLKLVAVHQYTVNFPWRNFLLQAVAIRLIVECMSVGMLEYSRDLGQYVLP